MKGIPGGKEWIKNELRKLGPMTRGERTVLAVFCLAAVLWTFGPVIRGLEIGGVQYFKSLSDAIIGVGTGLLLFVIPVDAEHGIQALDWKSAEEVIALDVLLLFGGGLSMAAAIETSGVAAWIGAQASIFNGVSEFWMMTGLTTAVNFVSEVTSNTALAATVMPIVNALCQSLNINPEGTLFAVTLGCSLPFMMPVATPPNAIVFSTGRLRIKDMMFAGFWLSLIAIIVSVLCAWFFAGGILPH